ncbi:MAG TPA: PEP-CTERM sorting domain-containing protein [Pirellulales bacterium]|jgi:hypothetical protein
MRITEKYLTLRVACCAAALVSATVFARQAEAQYSVRASTTVQTSGFGISDPQYNNDDTGNIQALSVSSGPFTVTSFAANYATATAYGEADLGALHGYANFAAATADAPAGASASGSVESWGDTITITSDTLPIGTPVDLQATLILHRTISGSQPQDNNIQIQTYASSSFGLSVSDSYYFPDPTQSQTTTVSFLRVGDSFQIQGSLSYSAAGTAFFDDTPLSGSIDVSNTALFTLVPLTSGVSYSTSSGVSYVPEPASLALAAMGLVFGCLALRRK